jgi:hypothetical protein
VELNSVHDDMGPSTLRRLKVADCLTVASMRERRPSTTFQLTFHAKYDSTPSSLRMMAYMYRP